MRKFIKRILWFSLPFLLPVFLFLIIDPYMLFGNNKGKIRINNHYNITWNRDFQSTELFLKNYNTFKYDSFIFGNSRSFFFDVKKWQNHIEGSCFHFNSSAESLFGIEGKIRFLDQMGTDIKNALIIIDRKTLRETNNSNGHLFIKHPLISNESQIPFYSEMYKGFFPKPMIAYIDLSLTGRIKEYMSHYGIRENVWKINYKNNQLQYFLYDSILKTDIEHYYQDRKNEFYDRDTLERSAKLVIREKQIRLLTSMKAIFENHNTNYKIIINPLYDQIKMNKNDIAYLKTLFGEENVFDFSGINKYTESIYNYYETSHYRPIVSNAILDEIYN